MGLIKNHPIEWQFYLWNDLLIHKENVEAQEAAAAVERRIEGGELQLNIFPLFSSPVLTDLMEEYLSLLQLVGEANKEASQTTFEQTEKEKKFILGFEECIMSRLIF